MALKEFVFCLLREPPRGKQEKNYWLVEYTKRKHGNPIINKVVTSVDEILETLLNNAQFKDKKNYHHLYIYFHSREEGTINGKLGKNDSFHAITITEAEKYRNSSNFVKEITKNQSAIKKVYLLGCNFGKSPSAKWTWCEIFGGGNAEVTVADRKVDWGVIQYWLAAKQNKTEVLGRFILLEGDINQFIEDAKAKYPKMKWKKGESWDTYQTKANKKFDDWLKLRYDEMNKADGKTLAFSLPNHMKNLRGDDLKEQMRNYYFESRGIPILILSKKTIPLEVWTKGYIEDRKEVRGLYQAIYPEDNEWENHIISEIP